MRRKRRNRKSRSLSVLCISTIISLSMMGIGYGMWSDGLNIDVNITTGNIGGRFVVGDSKYGGLNMDISNEGKTIAFSGEVYPDFEEDLTITIKDTGTVPMVLKEVNELENTKIVELNQEKKARYGLFSSFIKDDVIETFQLNISPPKEEKKSTMMQISSYSMEQNFEEDDYYQNEINRLENEINEIQEEINTLNIIKKHNFNYELQFIQGI